MGNVMPTALDRRLIKVEAAIELTFDEALRWVDGRNPAVAKAIMKEIDRLNARGEPVVDISNMTLEEATRIYNEKLR